ncbi:polyprenyl synthetase family protein [Clostridium sp. MSJ-4]|uniref:Polyprenyl synthetase family protein n=1 Tax=Clostridium simiarum TaxID=2841506 RepID=A0ABS6EVL8_9CLOT|nr:MULTISPECIES: polyprenyl synthetase family protein [Clostridium]MBU5590269.1 polyprenyl synthetase family protein [Clostridium simiarum]
MEKFWDKYPEIKTELQSVVDLMKTSTKCRDKIVETSIHDLINSGGKMLRPAFVLISSKFGDYKEERAHAMAAVVELIHMATLVHDDVIDDSKLRRGQETIQSKYGKDYAVYIGDFLFCVCFKILASTSSLSSIKIDSNSMSRICLGEIDQMNSRFTKNISVKKYLSRISAKTAELFSLALYSGAAESGCDEKINKLFWNIGHNIGMAFQIIDDILDYTGNEKSIKKTAANDLRQGIYTLPVIYAIQSNSSSLEPILMKDSYSEEDIKVIVSLVNKEGGVKKSTRLAERYTEKAFKLIKRLPENEYKYILTNITKELLQRSY